MTAIQPPLSMLLELTHRCPLQCPYCSNPLELARADRELPTEIWCDVITQGAEMGMLQVHFSGGEPAARTDLEDLLAHAKAKGLYANLITSGVGLKSARLARLVALGLDHVQLSLQDAYMKEADRIAGLKGAFAKKQAFAQEIIESGLALTINLVVHRHNIHRVGAMIDLANAMGAQRVEVAHTQYYGWGLANRAALMPTREDVETALGIVETVRAHYRGRMRIDHVIPDYYAERPKACMGGWAQRFLVIDPAGDVLPCHAAKSLPGLSFDNVREKRLSEIWTGGAAFEAYRGTDWMPKPCRDCDRKEIDWGGCRCQAFALTGDAAAVDPACGLSPRHATLRERATSEAAAPPPPFRYRRMAR